MVSQRFEFAPMPSCLKTVIMKKSEFYLSGYQNSNTHLPQMTTVMITNNLCKAPHGVPSTEKVQ